MRKADFSRRGSLLTAASILGLTIAVPAGAQERNFMVEDSPEIISNDAINPNLAAPTGSLDLSGVTIGLATGVNGIGQMTVRGNPATTGLSLCTGTLINPRTVIFAAHCVNTRPSTAYGPNGTANGLNPNGTPIAFGFGADNRPAVRQWLGLASVTGGTDANAALLNASNPDRALYNVEQIWYDPRSLAPGSNGFLEGDIALATLDTPAFGVPTWTMLFSPLTQQVHSQSIGYGTNGTSLSAQTTCTTAAGATCGSIDFRRRAVENMLSVLGSLDDRRDALFGAGPVSLEQSLYMQDFDSPSGQGTGFDIDVFNGPALPREGTTAGGDSGGPLVIDQHFNRPVFAGVLSGGSRFFAAQRFSTYGTHNFYQPLFLFWDAIVANNSYVYAGNVAGDGNWEDSAHWVQAMDPNYAVERGGALVNDLPDTPALGVSGATNKFGEICNGNNCTNVANDAEAAPVPVGSGTGLVIAGGPGSTGFVPDNIRAHPKNGVKARYFDVTLAAAGTTNLSSAVTIDMMTIAGPTKLDIKSAGSLSVLGEFTQWNGWTNIDGTLKTGGDAMIATGFLTGSGTLDVPFLTIGAVTVAPGGGNSIGKLTVKGDVILSSATSLFIDAQRGKADELRVLAGNGNTGILALDGAVVFNKVADAPAPRHGESYIIASAVGGIDGVFSGAFTFQGVLRPELTYSANNVTATLRAGSLVTILDGQNSTAIAFAGALDALRGGSYNNLYNLYGSVDWMNGPQLSATLSSLTPRVVGDVGALHDRQSKMLMGNVTDRLSLLASGGARGLTMVGQPSAAFAANGKSVPSGTLGFGASHVGTQAMSKLPGEMTGFISGGVDRSRSSYGNANVAETGQGGWHMAMGLEMPVGDAVLGTAAGFAEGESTPGADSNRSRTTMAAAYASMPLGGGFYVGGLLSAESSRAAMNRLSTDGNSMLRLSGASNASRYSAVAEAGYAVGIGRGLTLTPRTQVAYGRYSLDGFSERGGETALKLDAVTVSRVEARLGAKLDGKTMFGDWAVTPSLSADYVSLLAGRKTGATVRFAAAPDEAFLLPLSSSASGWVEFKGGVTVEKGDLSLGLSGQRSVGALDMSDQRGQVDLRFRF